MCLASTVLNNSRISILFPSLIIVPAGGVLFIIKRPSCVGFILRCHAYLPVTIPLTGKSDLKRASSLCRSRAEGCRLDKLVVPVPQADRPVPISYRN